MPRRLRLSLFWVLFAIVLVYFGDDLSLRFQIPADRPQFGTVHLQPFVAVPKKDGKTEFLLDDPVDTPCVYSLFPHLGNPPCWYLQRKAKPRVNL